MSKPQTFEEPVKEKKIIIPPYKFSLQYTKMPKQLKDWAIKEFGVKSSGKKHSEFMGKNVSICRKLLGLGAIIQSLTIDGKRLNLGLGPYSNHCWLPQINEADPDRKMMQVCLNCGSLFINDKFIPFTELKK